MQIFNYNTTIFTAIYTLNSYEFFYKFNVDRRICFVVLYIALSMSILKSSCDMTEVKLEFFKWKKFKIFMIMVLDILFCAIFFIDVWGYTIAIIVGILFILWIVLIKIFSDNILTYQKSFASIYLNTNEIIKDVRIDKIKKSRGWIILSRKINGHYIETRIKEETINRIDYYGDPLIIVKNIWSII